MKNKQSFAILAMASMMAVSMNMTAMADWSKSGDQWYYYNNTSGKLVKSDWVQFEGKWYYVDADGAMVMNQMIDDSFYVNESGEMVKDTWMLLQDGWSSEYGWRYFGDTGRVISDGWKDIGGSRYHFTDSVMDTGWLELEDDTYYLGSSGVMTTGWKKLRADGEEWRESWYYFDKNGKQMKKSEKKIDGDTYVFDEDGRMLTGWVNLSDFSSSEEENLSTDEIRSLCFYRSNGARAEGWQERSTPDGEDEGWMFFKNGRPHSTGQGTTKVGEYGMAKVESDIYCFNEQGIMVTGLVEIEDGRKFYFEPSSGKMLTGRVVVNDDEHDHEVFYFSTTGGVGSKGDGYTGVKGGILYEDGNVVKAEEGMRYEKVTVDGKDYLVNEKGGVKNSGTVKDADGVQYKVQKNSDGNYEITVIE
ncbi:MAG: hypothetical protein HFE84_03790 [Lachnospiraceae bacterium]|jgi:glucan-binding YG repeat protein|nr:hypothetical protein [Lachnospiraceae bacterium]